MSLYTVYPDQQMHMDIRRFIIYRTALWRLPFFLGVTVLTARSFDLAWKLKGPKRACAI